MSGIFSGHVFDGLGQTTAAEDASFNSLISSLAVPTTTAVAMAKEAANPPTFLPASAPSSYPSPIPSSDNTALYVAGGVAAVSVIAVLFMMSRRRVTPNRRRRRSRR